MMIAMSVLGFALGLSQTTTMDWVVNLVDDTSRGSALGLRVATNRVGQAFILAVAGAVSGVWGVEAAFVLLATLAGGLLEAYQKFGLINAVRIPVGILLLAAPPAHSMISAIGCAS